MAINYSLAKLNAKFGEKSDGKFYARAQVNSTTNLKEFSQLIASQTTVSRADVSAVLISSVENLIMELKRGNQVEFGELGKFRVQLMSEGTEKASDFTANKITGIRIQFVPGEDLDDLFSKLEFTPVASRLVQKAALKAEKAGATIIDINEAKTNARRTTLARTRMILTRRKRIRLRQVTRTLRARTTQVLGQRIRTTQALEPRGTTRVVRPTDLQSCSGKDRVPSSGNVTS